MARRSRGAQKQASSSKVFTLKNAVAALATIAFVIFFFPYVLVIAFSMLPSVVAFVVDRSPGKYLFKCVLAINACGTLPALLDLTLAGRDLEAVGVVISDVWYWLYAYGAAAFGWVLYGGVPRVIASYVSIKAQNRIKELRDVQAKLVDEWGEDVARQVRGGSVGAEPLGMPPEGESDEPDPAEDGTTGRAPQKAHEEQIESSSGARPRVGPPLPIAPGKVAQPNQFDDLGDEELKPGAAPPGLPAFD